jgi:hypothetical protein
MVMTKRRDADDFVRDMKTKQQHSTPGDIERKERIAQNAAEALRRIKSGQTYEDWRAIGHQMMVITEEVMNELALDEWDPDNKQLTREFTKRFEGWEATVHNAKPISKQERWALRELMTNPDYHAFYTTELVGPEQRKTNHPNKIIEKYKRKHPDPNKPKRERKPSDLLSPALTEKNERIKELEEELASARKTTPAEAETLAALRKQYVTRTTTLTIPERRKELVTLAHRMGFDIDIKDEPVAANLAIPGFKKKKPKEAPDKRKTKKRTTIGRFSGIGLGDMVLVEKK